MACQLTYLGLPSRRCHSHIRYGATLALGTAYARKVVIYEVRRGNYEVAGLVKTGSATGGIILGAQVIVRR